MQISANSNITELSLKAILLGIVLAALMAISNTFLALKIGVLTASSIPAAILSMGILRMFREHTILENNIVQTCASAGEAIAGGIVYTAPGLIILHAWHNFPYWETAALALLGGILGIIITIPLRKSYMENPELKFPEAQAISQVLLASDKTLSIKPMLLGGLFGAIMEIAQNSFKWLSPAFDWWITKGTTTFSVGIGFSATLIGAGYLMGFGVGLSILIGALISHIIGTPVYTTLAHASFDQANDSMRYMGIAAMLAAGLITLMQLLKPLYNSIQKNISGVINNKSNIKLRTEYDTPNWILIIGMLCLIVVTYIIYNKTFDPAIMLSHNILFITISIIFTIIIAIIFASMCAYFSGLVGVAASPGSAVAIASVLIAATILRAIVNGSSLIESHNLILAAEAIVIIITSVIMGAACVANNNSQDLKVGHIVGATPWKQQLMLTIGVIVAASIVPLIMELLYKAYGIAGSMPHAGMNTAASLSAPPAAAMAAITSSMFIQNLPYHIMLIGAVILVIFYFINLFGAKKVSLSLIGIAIGMYLPLDASTPLFIGSLISYGVAMHHKKQNILTDNMGTTIACGLVAGAAITNVLLAVPIALMKHPVSASSHTIVSNILAAAATLAISLYLYYCSRDHA
jgi:putative OPT family oligopeptide transporter